MIYNTLFIIGIVFVVLVVLIVIGNKLLSNYQAPSVKEVLPLEDLIEAVRKDFSEMLRMDVAGLNLNRNAVLQLQRNRKNLRIAYKNCALGDLGAKDYIKEYIKDLLEKKHNIKDSTIDKVIPFSDPVLLSAQGKHDVLLLYYKKKHKFDALDIMIKENNMIVEDAEKGTLITEEKLNEVYSRIIGATPISYADKMEVLAQRIYQRIKGNGVIDEIRDQKIDGVSGGVAGIPVGMLDYSETNFNATTKIPYSYDAVFIMYHGVTVRLEYLSFGSQPELERVCKNVYRFGNPGQLSKSKPYCINKMADGSRVVVTMPDFSDSWQFFIRKSDTADAKDIESLITDKNANVLISLLRFIMIGEQTTIITGGQGTGKTTILKSMIKFIRRFYNIRIQELAFELGLRKVFNFQNISTFQEGAVSGQEGLDIGKKTDGDVTIIGEIASSGQFAWTIQASGTASRFTLATQHSGTTKILVNSGTSALMQDFGYTSEMFACDRVIQALRFDMHLEKDLTGHRYVERVTEIVPGEEMGEYTIQDIVVWRDGAYYLVNPISEKTVASMIKHMTAGEKEEFFEYMKGVEKVA